MTPLNDNEKRIADMLVKIEDFKKNTDKSSNICIEKYKHVEAHIPHLGDFRLLLDGLIIEIADKFKTPVNGRKLEDSISYQIGASSSFVRTHFFINDAILSGNIIEASILIRSQIELITRLWELSKIDYNKLLNKTPNVGNQFSGEWKEAYYFLSKIAHFSSLDVAELIAINDFSRGVRAANLYPLFSHDLLECYKLQAFVAMNFLIFMIPFGEDLYEGIHDFSEDIVSFVILCGIIENSSYFGLELKGNKFKEATDKVTKKKK